MIKRQILAQRVSSPCSNAPKSACTEDTVPVISDLRVSVNAESVCRAWGERRELLARGRVFTLLADILRQMETEQWLEPAISYQTWQLTGSGSGWLELCNHTCLHSPLLVHRLRRATHLATGVCTLGDRLARQVSEYFAAGEPLKAVLLDEVGSLALYQLSDRLEEIIRTEARRRGLETSGVLNPGDNGFDLRAQAQVVALAGGSDIGIRVTNAGVLSPAKSLTLVMGMGKRMPRWRRGDSCGSCEARKRCPYRQLVSEDLTV